MSDFTSNFWSVFVTALTLVGIIGCAVLLWMAGRKKVVSTADNTTGHVWDEDLVEMNNPLPRWWVWMFVITIIFGLGYLAAYPGLGSSAGKLGWSQKGEYEAEVAKANKELEPLYARFVSSSTVSSAAWSMSASRPASLRASSARLYSRRASKSTALRRHAATASVMGCALQKTQPGWQMPARLEMPV